jgi:hypothetical protein
MPDQPAIQEFLAGGAVVTIAQSAEDAQHRRDLTKYEQDHRFALEKQQRAHDLDVARQNLKHAHDQETSDRQRRQRLENGLLIFAGVFAAAAALAAGFAAFLASDADVRKAAFTSLFGLVTTVITGVLGFIAGRSSK